MTTTMVFHVFFEFVLESFVLFRHALGGHVDHQIVRNGGAGLAVDERGTSIQSPASGSAPRTPLLKWQALLLPRRPTCFHIVKSDPSPEVCGDSGDFHVSRKVLRADCRPLPCRRYSQACA